MIKVLFFAELEEIVGSRELTIEKEEMTVPKLKEFLKEQFPTLPVDRAMMAINEEYVEETDIVKANDIVAFIPPVSGG
ncbi:molybdopterin converting factor subunit 1 [Anaerobacillus isosaccharinicus]|uniref:Molybdopterin synthase sulfur carrier subunit n=1 Tax=Anaerobacillus isosaccharinicus TaxID=1532552 RepID=A0A1S2L7D2_9BACI|nr:molybdopterin converting factor subunit 1 [Anaerobacillus isosaccharinicus]MBA5587703.1 molybdopterin converting factor subunit 1 [Anaerobacillus isosaccharinicus]QOY34129.1 molybdopterin converting factor subunit 1 [Anaerobacillus isosaccharinicus]